MSEALAVVRGLQSEPQAASSLPGSGLGQAKRGAIYFVGFLMQRGATAVLLPALVLRLSPTDLSRFGLLQSVVLIAPALLSLRVHTALGRLIYEARDFERSKLLWSGLVGGLMPVLAIGVAFALLSTTGLIQDPVSLGDPLVAGAVAIILLSRIVVEFASILFRAEGNAGKFFIVAAVDGASYLAFAVSLFAPVEVSYKTAVLALATASVGSLLGIIIALKGEIGPPQFSSDAYLASLKYASPTAGHMFGLWLATQAARWIGSASLGLDQIAGFSVAMLGLSIVTVASRVVFEVRRPTVGRAFATGDESAGVAVLAQAQWQAFAIASTLGVAGVVFYALIADWLGPSYRLPVVALMALAGYTALDSVSLRYTNLLLARKESLTLMFSSVAAGAATVASAALLVQVLGLTGLCLSVLVGAALQLVFVGAASASKHPSTQTNPGSSQDAKIDA